ncbi:MAG TPA: OmpH family outer membrane protein [Tepidisphaeraceae bacterium]|jgi:Skp family chaperone for outer membrane proteins
MRRTQRPPLLAFGLALMGAVTLLTGWCAAQAAGAAQGGGHQLNVGVVNTTIILRGMKETKKLEADSRARQQQVQQQGQQREMELDDLMKHRDNNLKPGSQQYRDETQKIMQKRAELEVWKQMSNLEAEQWYKENLKAVYDHIAQATAQVAQRQGLDLVIADQTPEIGPDLEKASLDRLQLALQSRAVLYANKKADITQDVLTVVEANFANQAPPAIPPAPPVVPTGAAAPVK